MRGKISFPTCKITTIWLIQLLLISSFIGLVSFENNNTVQATNDPLQPVDGGTVIMNREWTVTDTREYYNCTIVMNGNLIIENGGSLTFKNVTLKMNCSYYGVYRIEVQSGGAMYIFDYDDNCDTTEDASNITDGDFDDDIIEPDWGGGNYRFIFWVRNGAKFEMKNSELHECGRKEYELDILADNTRIENNIISKNYNGIYLRSSNSHTITNNIILNNINGILLKSSNSNTVTNNICKSNIQSGIHLSHSDRNTITNNICNSNKHDNIYLWSSANNTISNNICNWSYYDGGICLKSSSCNRINNNTCNSSSGFGIKLDSSHGNKIVDNTYNVNTGIWLETSNNNHIINNSCLNNRLSILNYDSCRNTFSNNHMSKSGIYIGGDYDITPAHWNTHSIDISNTVNGRPVYYWKNQIGGVVPLGAGQVILANCTNVEVYNQNLSNCYTGLLLGFSTECLIYNNTCNSNSKEGIELYFSSNNTIGNNTCSSNSEDGILLVEGSNNTITNNICNSNGEEGIRLCGCINNTVIYSTCNSNKKYGIQLWSSDSCTIANNICSFNMNGIFLSHSSNNILENNICSNNDRGISVEYSSPNNEVHYNNIYNNTDHGIFVYYPESCVNATYNWWGNVLGPYHATTNPNGTGDNVSDYVNFKPWLTTPNETMVQIIDTDNDGIPNIIDIDDDNDGYNDTIELSEGTDPLNNTSAPKDYDKDFIPDSIDLDDDNDGVPDEEDEYPFDETRWTGEEARVNVFVVSSIVIVVVLLLIIIITSIVKRREE